ncbi:GNAT family N-acetyltransferase [Sandarakinorhabdus sp.]|uniref:GNAT family N-acetyltransferase n=1 Tax=Sandarakinorhabdus sp. TaxID=1916663 RepID=UPI00286E0F2D|nr:GNAT family N-acetyltransferase [Sandarakinorhabdus sp.]
MIDYRDAVVEDGPLLGGIARATFIETFGKLYKLPDLECFLEQGSDAAYAAELADPNIAVRFACVGAVPIGFCKVSGLKLPATDPAPGAMELRQLYVFGPWQGLGIADVLTRWALDRARARGAPEIWLSVFTHNPRARRFYARHGFAEIAPYHFMVGDQADEDILCRAIL